MQAGLFAKKIGMTQIFDQSGKVLPVTILKTGACQISQIKTINTDGYNAIQVAYGEKKLENINKSIRGHLKKASDRGFSSFGEFRVTTPEDFKLGQIIKVDTFEVGQNLYQRIQLRYLLLFKTLVSLHKVYQ